MSAEQVGQRVKAVVSVPRLGFNDHFGALFETLGHFKLNPCWYTTAYWEKGIETAFEDCLFGVPKPDERSDWNPNQDPEVDLIIALDYDTVCTPDHIYTLIRTMSDRPDIDALASFQSRRGTGAPLCGIKGVAGDMATDGPFQVDNAAFGLTAIRAKSLIGLSKPWFWAVPSDKGMSRRNDFLDPDMYFWAKWKKEGRTVFVDPSLNIGHIEAMVSMFEEKECQSLCEELAEAHKHVEELEHRIAHTESDEEKTGRQLRLVQTMIRCSEWRTKYLRRASGRDLGNTEEKC